MSSTEPNAHGPARTREDRVRRWGLSDSEDLENALIAAERLLAEAEERRRHEENRTYTLISVMVGVVLSLLASLLAIRFVLASVPIAASVLILTLLIRALILQRQRLRRDYRLKLATRLAAMVRVTYLDVAEREEWSFLRRESVKLRLSAFPLPEPAEAFGPGG